MPDSAGRPAPVQHWADAILPPRAVVFALIALIVGAALALRLSGLDGRILAHPENFVPGLDMPDWVRFPPERTTIAQILRGTLIDGHPPAYFLALLPWVKAFGTDLFALRLPSALLGAASVWLLFLIGRRQHGPVVGLVASALLAGHAYHIYWSQMARMYVPVAFLGLLSTLWLLKAIEDGRVRSFVWYVATTGLALWTQLYAWPLLVGQVAWVVVGALAGRPWRRILRAQAIALALGAPVVQLSLFQNPPTRWHQATQGFFEFGYLFDARLPYWQAEPPTPSRVLVIGLCLGLFVIGVLAGVRRAAAAPPPGADDPGSGRLADWAVAAAVAAGMLILAWRWYGAPRFWVLAALPLGLVAAAAITDRLIVRLGPSPVGALARRLGLVPLGVVLAVLPVTIMLAVSVVRGVYVARGTVVFIPFVLLVVATGLVYLFSRRSLAVRALGLASAGGAAFVFVVAIQCVRQASSSPRDYRGLAMAVRSHLEPGDLMLVRNDYSYPPFLYYLDRSTDPQLVPDRWAARVQAAAPSRVWAVRLCSQFPLIEVEAALEGLHLSQVVPVTHGELRLYRRGPDSSGALTPASIAPSDSRLGCHPGDPAEGPARPARYAPATLEE